MIVLNDHEEIGSVSTGGADGPFLESILRRASTDIDFERVRANSLMISIDNAHGVHPNYASKHDESHRPLLNEGPVVKVNANHRYATTAITQGLIEQAAERADVPLQYFSGRADLGCGSTIGPLTAGRLGIDTIDLGCAQFAMHSARETCGIKDPELMLKLVTQLTKERPCLMPMPPDHPIVPKPKLGLLLINLGTPDALDYWSMRRYWVSF